MTRTKNDSRPPADGLDGSRADYQAFLNRKTQSADNAGFDPLWMPDFLFDFQTSLVDWSIRKGRAAIFADCGLGKTPMQLVWAENVVRKTNKPVLLLTPLAVSQQTKREAEKFKIEASISRDGKPRPNITITNYEKLHHFDRNDYGGLVCDESSILKNFDGRRKREITEFCKSLPYRLLCTATAAPNDYFELGTSSEALGCLGYMDMLTKFFKDETKKDYLAWGRKTYRFRGHSEKPFWRWVCSWARAIRRPSDIGFSDDGFRLPPLEEFEHCVENSTPRPGMLFAVPAKNLFEQRDERRVSINERCEAAASLAENESGPSVIWCHLNDEGDLLSKMTADSVQVSGTMSDESKEEKLIAFSEGQIKRLIIKPKIGCFGLNWQHCSNVVWFPSHSYEQYYQAVRRCYRFGQTKPVKVHIVSTEGEQRVLSNLQRKSKQAEQMFSSLIQFMNDAMHVDNDWTFDKQERIPAWL